MRSKIEVIPFQEGWAREYRKIAEKLSILFDGHHILFHHIGSTAIRDCLAKPIVDILGVTRDITLIDAYNSSLKSAGYTPLGEFGMKQRRYFENNGVHLHVFEESDPEVTRHLRFVNYLNAYPNKAKEYGALKQKLALEFPYSIDKYLLGKESFIKSIDMAAAQERVEPLFYPSLGPRKEKWTTQEIIDALHVNMYLQMSYFAKYIPTMHLIYQPDVVIVQSDIKDDTFNVLFSTQFTESNAKTRVRDVLKPFQDQALPFSWWVSKTEDAPLNLSKLLVECGLSLQEEELGMYLDLKSYGGTSQKHPIKRITSQEEFKKFAEIIAQIGGTQDAYPLIYRHIPSILYEKGASQEMYLLYDNHGHAVTSGIVLFHANVAGIYYIATLPSHRKQGLGSAMMHFLLTRAIEKGYHLSTLAASEEGKNLYRRLGFKECCSFAEFTKKEKHPM